MLSVYKKRRQTLLSELPDNSLVILVGYQQKVRSKNIKYHFRQDNDFFYLTGFNEPDSFALISKKNNEETFTLFCRPKDSLQEVNFGERAGVKGVLQDYKADLAFDIADFDKELLNQLHDIEHVYLSDELNRISSQLIPLLNTQRHNCPFDVVKQYRTLTPLAKIIHPMRVIKTIEEVDLIKAAVQASTKAHIDVMRSCSSAINESELSAQFMKSIATFGSTEVAYPNIVAAGNNAMCLHYEDNNTPIKSGQILLIDAGAELNMYASDITRSYPINGVFTQAQKQIYSLVLSALDAAIAIVKPGTPWNALHKTCMEVICKGLIELGFLDMTFEHAMETQAYKKFTVHKTGHWLGMDVHDVGPYHDEQGNWRKLEPNMIFTIEPGIYIPEDCYDVPESYRGMGIRVEDDILVTTDGHENLSAGVPRTIEDIEKVMAE
ncbi:Xaa-Pro aminopeptidase [Shewanella sp. OPT22]|nr:Xaa-Pro aminopeptidase [Shewanella sp. OPT22]